jgi:hypothetical protein
MSEPARESSTPRADPTQATRYRPPTSRLWWLHRRSYLLFVLRELSSLFVAWFVVYLLLLVDAVHGGSDSYRAFLELSGRPWMLARPPVRPAAPSPRPSRTARALRVVAASLGTACGCPKPHTPHATC